MKSDKEFPKACIILTNYNYGEFVCEAIESAANQTYDNINIYVVDDCSTDDSVEKIKSLLGENYWEHTGGIFFKEDSGGQFNNRTIKFWSTRVNVKQGHARNIAIEQALKDGCEYFAILDADDIMLPTKIEKCVAKIQEHPELIGSVHTDYYIECPEEGTKTLEFKPPYSQELLMRDCHLHSGGVISKVALEKVGLFDEDVYPKEDYLMWLKISRFFICVHIPEPLVRVRVTPKNTTVGYSNEFHTKQYQLMWEKYKKWIKE